MEKLKLIETGFLWLACVNPCFVPPQKKSTEKPPIHHYELSESSLTSVLNDIVKTYNDALESINLTDLNRLHLIHMRCIFTKFCNVFSSPESSFTKIKPALVLLHESLGKDYTVWKRYQEKNKISEELLNSFSENIRQLAPYCAKLKTS